MVSAPDVALGSVQGHGTAYCKVYTVPSSDLKVGKLCCCAVREEGRE